MIKDSTAADASQRGLPPWGGYHFRDGECIGGRLIYAKINMKSKKPFLSRSIHLYKRLGFALCLNNAETESNSVVSEKNQTRRITEGSKSSSILALSPLKRDRNERSAVDGYWFVASCVS